MKLYISSDLFKKIKNKLESELDTRLVYHNWTHTLSVMEYAEKFANVCHRTEHEKYLLQTAALFHDCGYLQRYENNEALACQLVAQILPEFQYSSDEIESISRMIQATAPGVIPISDLEKLLCDADLGHIASEDYIENSCNLRCEEKSMDVADMNDQVWITQELNFLLSHTFYTKEIENLLKANREKNVEKLKKIQKDCQVSEKFFSNIAETNHESN